MTRAESLKWSSAEAEKAARRGSDVGGSIRLGIDVGGTFTDLVLLNLETGEEWSHKLLTTPRDPTIAIVRGFVEILEKAAVPASEVKQILHGTTLVANALIERRGARTGLLTTEGFEDLLDIRRESRWDMYNLNIVFPTPLVPRALRTGVAERTYLNGDRELELETAKEAVGTLLSLDVQSVAICFLNSYLDGTNEQMVGQIVRDQDPSLTVTESSQLLPEFGEYERCSTAVANAYVQPLIEGYLQRVETSLRELGFSGALQLMLSNGGFGDIGSVIESPIRLLDSGPAGGALAGATFARTHDVKRLMVFDMGGTTAKCSLIEGGSPRTLLGTEAAREDRYKKGSGLPVRMSTIDLLEVGAGGGSVAWVDAVGALRVGPTSMGAEPGPVCYGLGGTEPTVTDADLVLGYLGENSFLGGEMKLHRDRAEESIASVIGEPLGLTTVEAAWGIHRIINQNMANAAKLHILEKAANPSHYAMMALGGAGPVHACRVAESLKVTAVVAPPSAGVKSALGFLIAPWRADFVRYRMELLDRVEWADAEADFADLENQALEQIQRAGVAADQIRMDRVLDMRYVGQGREIPVACKEASGLSFAEALREAFNAEYSRRFGRSEDSIDVEIVNWRLYAVGPWPEVPRAELEPIGMVSAPERRNAFFPEVGGFVECDVFDREELRPDSVLKGPAIVEERDSTLVITPQARALVDHEGIIRIDFPSFLEDH